MRYLAGLFILLLLIAQITTTRAQGQHRIERQDEKSGHAHRQAAPDSIVALLVNAAVTDLHDHGPSGPVRFRKVRLGHLMTPKGPDHYRLCGQFMRVVEGAKPRWIPFVTIKTSGYEQYVGGQASKFCEDPAVKWDKAGDLTARLQHSFDALR